MQIDHVPTQLPAFLYGTKKDTRAASRRICRQAWKAGTWKKVFADLQLIEFETKPGWIVVNRIMEKLSEPRVRWNMTWICESMRNLAREKRSYEKAQRLNIEGMSSFWYTVAMLDQYADLGGPVGTHIVEWRIELLKQYVNWLPELVGLAKHFVHELMVNMDGKLPARHQWYANIVTCAREVGFDLHWGQVIDAYEWDIITALLDKSIIVTDGTRFRVRTVDAGQKA
jgi:hypothetical protein